MEGRKMKKKTQKQRQKLNLYKFLISLLVERTKQTACMKCTYELGSVQLCCLKERSFRSTIAAARKTSLRRSKDS